MQRSTQFEAGIFILAGFFLQTRTILERELRPGAVPKNYFGAAYRLVHGSLWLFFIFELFIYFCESNVCVCVCLFTYESKFKQQNYQVTLI